MRLFVLIFFLNIDLYKSDFVVEGNFFFGYPDDHVIEIEETPTEVFNFLNKLKKFQDEFNFINMRTGTSVVYSLNDEMFSTICESINKVFVPTKVNECTIDLPVYYLNGNSKIILFMTKSGVLRNTSAVTDCSDDYELFNFGTKIVKRVNKTAVAK